MSDYRDDRARGAFGLSRSAALAATLLVAVVLLVVVGWPKKE